MAHRRELRVLGVGKDRIRRAVHAGRWLEPIPGVIVLHSGSLTRRERLVAALTWAGDEGRLSHTSALHHLGARIEEPVALRRVAGVRGQYEPPPDAGLVQVTVPHGRHLESAGFVVVHQTRRPLGELVVDGLRTTSAARAAIDVALTATRRQDVDHVIADVLQKGLARVEDLVDEVRLAGRRATSWLKDAVADAARGMRSVGESDLRRVIVSAGLPEPEWGAEIVTPAGTYFVDAYWRARRVAAEADGAAFHLSAADWEGDLRRQNAIQGEGVRLFRFPVRRLRSAGPRCAEELWQALGR
ncbi:endonuclease domain-containing protein [Blastococcus sp. PRF04-17]|uniref:endonuclease domain-containing protein n=1 Tax=Blastococcus sp. PRF04-17 TaxID=2933797 RepID=UPI001FF54A0A|nr:endonuclease domain-containing protein [Blastococcus sp. PRF04-17]UOY00578.1 endonuclease domain-containing protein [Blastococcus sp. PRF04-17]